MYNNKNHYEKKIDVLICENHFCLITDIYHICKENKRYQNLCRRCLNTKRSQTKFEEHMARCIKRKVCKTYFLHPNQKIKLIHSYMKKDLTIWIATDFECINVPNGSQSDPNAKQSF